MQFNQLDCPIENHDEEVNERDNQSRVRFDRLLTVWQQELELLSKTVNLFSLFRAIPLSLSLFVLFHNFLNIIKYI